MRFPMASISVEGSLYKFAEICMNDSFLHGKQLGGIRVNEKMIFNNLCTSLHIQQPFSCFKMVRFNIMAAICYAEWVD